MSRMILMLLSALMFVCCGCQTFTGVYFNPVCFRGDCDEFQTGSKKQGFEEAESSVYRSRSSVDRRCQEKSIHDPLKVDTEWDRRKVTQQFCTLSVKTTLIFVGRSSIPTLFAILVNESTFKFSFRVVSIWSNFRGVL